MKKDKRDLSIRRIILLIFVISLFISAVCYGTLIFTNWITSSKKITERMASHINESIYEKVYALIQMPYHINEINSKIIENGMLNISDEKQRERFFVEVLQAHSDEIYSFSYGTANGEYYGARRNEIGIIEIMRNNAATKGSSWYYSVDEDLTAGDLVSQAGPFDPRTRAWYKFAVKADGPIFSPIYKHFVMDDLSVSAAWPIYNETGRLDGVIGTHMLLSEIGTYLKSTVNEYGGIAIIMEKDSNNLIANSMDMANFTVLKDGKMERYGLEHVENNDIQSAYEEYKAKRALHQNYQSESDKYFINTREIHAKGIEWVVISAIPKSIFIVDIINSMYWAGFIATISLLLSVVIYNLFMTKYLKPMKTLLRVSDSLATGDLSTRVDITRNDEIGLISKSFNSFADTIQSLIENLETNVQLRTQELHKANMTLAASQDELRLIIDSAAEAIYGIDLEGNCTFCNKSCIQMLAYSDETELLDKNMHWQIHHTRKDGTPFLKDDCKVYQALTDKEGVHVDDEVFWRSDGTSFDVEYFSYPKIRNGEIIGAVITFMDISERKQKEAKIQYLNYYDTLTGLHNRRYFEENRAKYDNLNNLPLSVIFADINGLKMTNDIFGHSAGDELIKKASDILKQICGQGDMVARVGGDEFIILLPQTTKENAQNILARIRSGFIDARIEAIKCSISIGLDTKMHPDQSLDEIIANAENAMYHDKTMNRKTINKVIIDTIIETLHSRNSRVKEHSNAVGEMCSVMGSALYLNDTNISKLTRAGYLHDIGKIVLSDDILSKDALSEDELEKMYQHPAVGYRILNLFDDTLDLAEYVYAHHEKWDGTGYPRGLKGEQIPLISRIIAVVETYDRVLNSSKLSLKERKSSALEIMKKGARTQFEPKIVEKFIQMIEKDKAGEK